MSDDVDIVQPKKSRTKQPNNNVYKAILAMVALVAIIGISFYGGTYYQRHHGGSAGAVATSSGLGGFGGRRLFASGNRTIGSVTAIDSGSISVQDSSGATKTFTTNSSTVISDSGQTVTYSDIQVGDTVFVSASSSSATSASRIVVNPQFGGFGGTTTAPPNSQLN